MALLEHDNVLLGDTPNPEELEDADALVVADTYIDDMGDDEPGFNIDWLDVQRYWKRTNGWHRRGARPLSSRCGDATRTLSSRLLRPSCRVTRLRVARGLLFAGRTDRATYANSGWGQPPRFTTAI